MNPYASHLGSRDPIQVIQATPARLAELVAALGPDGVQRSLAPGKWSAREIICHLADCEIVFAFRIRQALAETHHVIQPFDQEKWAATYAAYDTHSALTVFTTVRAWNVSLLQSLTAEMASKGLTHPERGDMSLQTVVETMGGHDLNHQRQIEGILGQATASARA